MKTLHLIALLLLVALASCVTNPRVVITEPDGTKTELTTGQNLMAEVDEQVSEVEGGGYHLRHMVKRQDATRAPIAFAQTVGTLGLGYIGYLDHLAQEVTSRMAAGEITKREGQALLAQIERDRIAAGVTGATTVNPNLPIPLRK
jgi:hypothetical protein